MSGWIQKNRKFDPPLLESYEWIGIHARSGGGPSPSTTTTTRVAPKIEEPRKPKEEPKEKKPDKPQTTLLVGNTLPPQPKPASSSTPTKQPPSKPVPQAKKFEHDGVEKPSVGKKTDLAQGKGKEAILEEETKRDLKGSKGKLSNSGVVTGGLRGVVARRGMVNLDWKLLVKVGVVWVFW
ncbi:hypothetical protein L1987_51512 [Smallanthus sonchifolius]|uniref:Uncharacterized protein n=2 Tax=Smallanthus sonchifolius TaxID=185202 RepID=A0ACB9ER97_9ASTR|nr:hypothetical protein L1987_51511 [Smallanthus sonchifolius]KAI3761104.1 hypothetical protein L1987_51512 [Smallanthus sonchifolius]